MVNAKSVGKGVFKTVNEYVKDEVYEKWMHRGLGYPGDILFVTEGHTFGNTCLVPDYLKKFALGQRVITIKGHSEVIDNAFLGTYMQMEQFKQDIDVYKTGGTAQGIRSKDLLKIRLPLPKYKEQKEFADKLEKATIDTIEAGEMTKDLALITTLENPTVLNSEGFIKAIAKRL